MRPLAENIHVRLQDELLRAIDVFRRSEVDLPTRPEAVRRLLQQAMTRQEPVAAPPATITKGKHNVCRNLPLGILQPQNQKHATAQKLGGTAYQSGGLRTRARASRRAVRALHWR